MSEEESNKSITENDLRDVINLKTPEISKAEFDEISLEKMRANSYVER